MKVAEPSRVERSYVQKIDAGPEKVFPLLCPVREAEWVKGWDPYLVLSRSGYAEKDCVFLTGDPQEPVVWVMTELDPVNFRLEIVKVTPGETVGKITIALERTGEDATNARVTYMYTALSGAGEEFVREYTEEFYLEFMQYWEKSLNRFLKTGGT
ncbi:hypothetical protein [Syntrophobacter fumaroxidans]|uniref:Activator of Hsp90 ATPase 1 family protein n=1 Tax=Syntrophobacter fumaroxidans (strain DSM 10017 / MPOB) TaxID=335543 RepID=A0LMX0_SYNFM|nr:hypothetical protein [Syntrophobacter fumaroxidans]ABK18772.1 hypothetical protein Sfum_3099 [Syntrophobacter fumaroxidans MPOB]